MEEVNIKKKIRDFLFETFLLGDTTTQFADRDSFLENGIIDSTGILELITFVEENFNISIEEDEMVPNNLDSLENIHRFIVSKFKNLSLV